MLDSSHVLFVCRVLSEYSYVVAIKKNSFWNNKKNNITKRQMKDFELFYKK